MLFSKPQWCNAAEFNVFKRCAAIIINTDNHTLHHIACLLCPWSGPQGALNLDSYPESMLSWSSISRSTFHFAWMWRQILSIIWISRWTNEISTDTRKLDSYARYGRITMLNSTCRPNKPVFACYTFVLIMRYEYRRRTRSVPWLLKLWFRALPGNCTLAL